MTAVHHLRFSRHPNFDGPRGKDGQLYASTCKFRDDRSNRSCVMAIYLFSTTSVSQIERNNGRKSPILTYPTCIGAAIRISPRSLTPRNYCPGLSCCIACLIIPLAVLIEHRLVTDRRTDRQTRPQHIQHQQSGASKKIMHSQLNFTEECI